MGLTTKLWFTDSSIEEEENSRPPCLFSPSRPPHRPPLTTHSGLLTPPPSRAPHPTPIPDSSPHPHPGPLTPLPSRAPHPTPIPGPSPHPHPGPLTPIDPAYNLEPKILLMPVNLCRSVALLWCLRHSQSSDKGFVMSTM